MSSQKCLEPNTTKIIHGVSVAKPCWKVIEINECGHSVSSACKALQDEGCSQIDSQCLSGAFAVCDEYHEVWSCPSKQTTGHGITCGDRFYCLDGKCQATVKEENHDFGKSISELAAVNQAGQEIKDQHLDQNVNPKDIRVFAGTVAECSEDAAGVNCCADSGWGKGVLGSCSDKEKALGHAKEKGLVQAAGGYCNIKTLGICLDWRRRYCIFPNKLSLDVQRDGRLKQLHRDFGHKKETDCSGLTPDELGKMDFSKMDFSNVVANLKGKAKNPDASEREKSISGKIIHHSNQKNNFNPSLLEENYHA